MCYLVLRMSFENSVDGGRGLYARSFSAVYPSAGRGTPPHHNPRVALTTHPARDLLASPGWSMEKSSHLNAGTCACARMCSAFFAIHRRRRPRPERPQPRSNPACHWPNAARGTCACPGASVAAAAAASWPQARARASSRTRTRLQVPARSCQSACSQLPAGRWAWG